MQGSRTLTGTLSDRLVPCLPSPDEWRSTSPFAIRRSAAWYSEVLGMRQRYDYTSDDRGMRYVFLVEPTSKLVLCLVGHAPNPGEVFSEFRTGLEHWTHNGGGGGHPALGDGREGDRSPRRSSRPAPGHVGNQMSRRVPPRTLVRLGDLGVTEAPIRGTSRASPNSAK